jgi:hypothetical protein
MPENRFSTIIDAKAEEGMLARLNAVQTIIQDRILKPLRQLSANFPTQNASTLSPVIKPDCFIPSSDYW